MSTLERVAGRPTWLLGRANARAQALLVDAFAQAGMRGHHFRTTGIDTSDVVAAVNALVSAEFARRQPDDVDRRRNIISITDSGLVAVERVGSIVDGVQRVVLEPLSEHERKTFLRLLAKLV
jgi:hypothetical protein